MTQIKDFSMSAFSIAKRSLCLPVLRHIALATLFSFTGASQGWSDIISHRCLDRQQVFGQSTTVHVHSAVEPTVAVNPLNFDEIVTCWQQGRISNGGSLEAGISYTKDGGKHWHQSRVPFQICDNGIAQRVSDLWLSYAPDGKKVYLSARVFNATTEANTENQQGIVVSVSENGGKTWRNLTFLAASLASINEPTQAFAVDHKPSSTADPNHSSFAYTVWDRFDTANSFHSTTRISRTATSGKSWSTPYLLYDPFPDLTATNLSNGILNDNSTQDNVVVVLPKSAITDRHWQKDKWGGVQNKVYRYSGDQLNFMVRKYARPGATDAQYTTDTFPFKYTLFDIAVVRSIDHGATWGPTAKVITSFIDNLVYTRGYNYFGTTITGGVGNLLRTADTVPAYAVNSENGFLYVVWQTGEFTPNQLPQIALSTSRDGGRTWSFPVRVSRTPLNAINPQAFTPSVAVTKKGRVGILYFDLSHDKKSNPNETKVDAWLAIYKEVKSNLGGSTGIGLDFVKEIHLSKKSYIAQKGPSTNQGNMVDGDYPFLVANHEHFYAAYTKSFNKRFTHSRLFFNNPLQNAQVLVDDNHRQAPFISIIKSSGKTKGRLISTEKMHWEYDK